MNTAEELHIINKVTTNKISPILLNPIADVALLVVKALEAHDHINRRLVVPITSQKNTNTVKSPEFSNAHTVVINNINFKEKLINNLSNSI